MCRSTCWRTGAVALALALALASTPVTAGPHQAPTPSPTPVVHFTPPPVDQSVTDALADGVVTREEYDRAVANTMRCLDEKGVQHSTPIYQESRRQYTFSVMSPTGPGNGPTEYDDCWMRYERDVTSEWVRAGPPPEHGIEAKALRCARMRVVEFAMNQALNRWLLGFWPARAELRACGNFRG